MNGEGWAWPPIAAPPYLVVRAVRLLDVPDDWPLGGHTYVDSVGATMIFGIVFGLSIDYAVFLLARMRESYRRDHDNRDRDTDTGSHHDGHAACLHSEQVTTDL